MRFALGQQFEPIIFLLIWCCYSGLSWRWNQQVLWTIRNRLGINIVRCEIWIQKYRFFFSVSPTIFVIFLNSYIKLRCILTCVGHIKVISILKTQKGSTCDAAFCVFLCVFLCFQGFVLLSSFPGSECWAACFLLVCARDICSRRMSSHCFLYVVWFFVVTLWFFYLPIWKYQFIRRLVESALLLYSP
jgi:hypothetical protein